MFGAKLAKFACFFIAVAFAFSSAGAAALGSQPVISHLKTGETGFASNEFIAIYNNSSEGVDLTGWCLVYSSASDITKSTLACLNPPDENTSLVLEPFGYARFSSAEFKAALPGFEPDGVFSISLSGTSGHIRLLDNAKNEIDKLAWGTAASPEGIASLAHGSGFILQRKLIPETNNLQDLNNNFEDFTENVLETVPASGLFEENKPIDVCPNLPEIQAALPDDYYPDENGECWQDQCDNLDGLQKIIPAGYISSDGENCSEIVINLESSILHITELLPNASSVDTGKEFIEIYNPNPYAVELEGYIFELGPAYTKTYTLKQQLLDPFSYVSFSDLITGLTLPNSSASVRLVAPAGMTVNQTDEYSDPKDDMSWSLIDGVWQYTSLATPGSSNQASPGDPQTETGGAGGLADCGPGKFRNPETNRCKTISLGDTELKPCLEGQIRNLETNRCRSASSADSLVPCKVGQERNPETNRCRSIVSTASVLKPCEPGQERNPETNRCRKAAALGASTLADVQDVPSESHSSTNWWLAGVIITAAAGYGVYEWRAEIIRGLSRLRLNK